MGKVVKTGISYQPDVYRALEELADRYFKGNMSAAQNYVNRKALRLNSAASTQIKQATLF